MRKVFPFSFKGRNMGSVIFSTLIYTLIFILFAVVAVLLWLFGLPDVGNTIVNIVRQILLLYCVSGIVVAVLYAAEVIEKKD